MESEFRKYGDFMMQVTSYQRLPQPQLLFINDLERIIGKSRLTLRRWWEKGDFPKPVKINGKTLAWEASVIEDWIRENFNLNG